MNRKLYEYITCINRRQTYQPPYSEDDRKELLEIIQASLSRGLDTVEPPVGGRLVELPMTDGEYVRFCRLTKKGEVRP